MQSSVSIGCICTASYSVFRLHTERLQNGSSKHLQEHFYHCPSASICSRWRTPTHGPRISFCDWCRLSLLTLYLHVWKGLNVDNSERSEAIPGFNWDFSSSSSSSSSSTGSWPKNFDISTMVYGITIRLAGMKALAVTKQLWANCVGSLRETDAGVRYPQNKDFSRTVGTTATKLTGMTVPPVSNPRQTNSDCTIRQTRSLFYQLKLTLAASDRNVAISKNDVIQNSAHVQQWNLNQGNEGEGSR